MLNVTTGTALRGTTYLYESSHLPLNCNITFYHKYRRAYLNSDTACIPRSHIAIAVSAIRIPPASDVKHYVTIKDQRTAVPNTVESRPPERKGLID